MPAPREHLDAATRPTPSERLAPESAGGSDRLVEESDRAHERALVEIRAHVRFADRVAALQLGGEADPFYYRVHAPS